jgi:hypothetical protein
LLLFILDVIDAISRLIGSSDDFSNDDLDPIDTLATERP